MSRSKPHKYDAPILDAIRTLPGSTLGELREHLYQTNAIPGPDLSAVAWSLTRMLRNGQITRTGQRRRYRYWLPEALPLPTKNAPRVGEVLETLEQLRTRVAGVLDSIDQTLDEVRAAVGSE